MIRKEDYLKCKHIIKCMSINELERLSEKVGLTDYEEELVISLQQNKSKVGTCMDLCISGTKYQCDMKRALSKLCDDIKNRG